MKNIFAFLLALNFTIITFTAHISASPQEGTYFDYLHQHEMVAYSADGKHIAFEFSDFHGKGSNYLVIMNVDTKRIIHTGKSRLSINFGDIKIKDKKSIEKYIKNLDQKTQGILRRGKYDFNKNLHELVDYEISYNVKDRGDEKHQFRFYLKDNKTGFAHPLKNYTVMDGTGPDFNTPAGTPRFSGQSCYLSVNGKSCVFFYKTYSPISFTENMEEFTKGLNGVLIINKFDFSRFYNGIGLRYYKKKKYDKALDNFLKSIDYDNKYPRGIFNTACMLGIQKKAVEAVDYLKMLKFLNTKNSRKYLEMIKEEKDLNNIRNSPQFIEFIKGI